MTRLSLALLCLTTLCQIAHAAPSPCTVEIATNQVQIDNMQRRGRAAKATMPVLNELQAITSMAKDPRRAVGDQLAPRDAARFAELAHQNKLIRLSAFVESAYARDANIVQQMATAAWKNYADPSYVPPDSDVASAALGVMRIMMPEAKE